MKHAVIFVPGLHDSNSLNKLYSSLVRTVWSRQGIYIEIFYPEWENGKSLNSKLFSISKRIVDLNKKGYKVSLVGQSAGGSFILNSYATNKNLVHKAINITGRLRAGVKVKPSLEYASRDSKAFKDSVILFETKNTKLLTKNDLKKVMILVPFFDEVVPKSTVPLEGAKNLSIPMIEHGLSGGFAAIIWSKKLINFLN